MYAIANRDPIYREILHIVDDVSRNQTRALATIVFLIQ